MRESHVSQTECIIVRKSMDEYTRMLNEDANDCDKLKKALLTRYSFTEDSYRQRFNDVLPETW